MLKVTTTPNAAGVMLSGGRDDLEALCRAVYDLVGEEGDYEGYEDAADRLSILYHALRLALKQGALTVRLLWPDALFCSLLLADYLALAYGPESYLAAGGSDLSDEERETYFSRLDGDAAAARLFMGLVWAELKRVVGEEAYLPLAWRFVPQAALGLPVGMFAGFCTPYLDRLNAGYLEAPPEERPGMLAAVARKLLVFGEDYWQANGQARMIAYREGVPLSEVHLPGVRLPQMREGDW